MNIPSPGDYIDIHNHGGSPAKGYYTVENLMAHENRIPDFQTGTGYTFGIHPWHLTDENFEEQFEKVKQHASHPNVLAVGEAGFDRFKGPGKDLQQKAFEAQVRLSEELKKPVFIHCVRSWDELVAVHRKFKPVQPWLIHGFRGSAELALQLIAKNMYISFWFDFVIRPEATALVKRLPADRIFLETDGSGVGIESIYNKVAIDLGTDTAALKSRIMTSFSELFNR
jgi:TatD DNase family protein